MKVVGPEGSAKRGSEVPLQSSQEAPVIGPPSRLIHHPIRSDDSPETEDGIRPRPSARRQRRRRPARGCEEPRSFAGGC